MHYLICEDFAGQPVPFLFPDRVDHADMRDQLPYGRILGGGDVVLEQGKPVCSGGCSELAVTARPLIDAAIIVQALQ